MDICLVNNIKMEVKEIVEAFLHDEIVEVHFRFVNDDEDTVRVDEFQVNEFFDYGYNVVDEETTLFEYDEDDDEFDLDFLDREINEPELISFMNEYYMVTGDIPNAEFF
jgi:hypothetical protein